MKENSLAALAARHGVKLGTVISHQTLGNESMLHLWDAEFNSLTPANELKAYSLLDRAASERKGDYALDFTKADDILRYAGENGFAVRGHTLVGDAFMCDWFFRVGCQKDGEYLGKDAMRDRLKRYIADVLTHCETEFAGLIYAWDVVNEAVADGLHETEPHDTRRVRRLRDGKINPFAKYVGEDYVEFAFLCARDILDQLHACTKLIYNDYNTFLPDKREAICALAQSINTYARDELGNGRRLLDGIGMQSYIGGFGKQEGCMEERDIALVRDAVKRYAECGLEVQITEAALRNYQNDPETLARHAAFYGKYFDAIVALTKETTRLTSVSVWGLIDHPDADPSSYGYRMNGPYCGLYDEHFQPKPAYTAVRQALSAK